MRSILALATLAILGNLDVALASVCKPHRTNTYTTNTLTAAPTTTETKGPLVVKNEIGNGNFAIRDPKNPRNIPRYTVVEGQAQVVDDKGYTRDGSKEKDCVELSANNNPTRKRAIGNIVSISQQLVDLDIKKKYTVRFFYAVITASSINVCTLSASIGGHQFFTSTIMSIGQAADWNTVLTQTDVPNTQGAFSVSVNCPIGGVASIYVDSIFMSNQVTPETIDDVKIDYGNEGDVSSTAATSKLAESTTSNAPSSKESSDVDTFSPSTKSWSGSETATYGSTGIQTREYTPTTASDNAVSTESSLPSGSRVCPAGAPPPGYCKPVQPQVTQTVSLPGIPQLSENDRPDAPRACWAYGVPKLGTWGRTKWSNPRQNSIADCALLCKKEGPSCKAFALNTNSQETTCSLLGDRLGVTGIDLNKQRSLVWNDFDCFECHDCDIKNPADVSTETSSLELSSTTSLPEITSETAVMTSVAPSATTSCPHCHQRSSPSSDLVCEKIGNLRNTDDLNPYANNDFDKATLQTTSEQCATICFQLSDCTASAYDYARRRCIFTNTAMTSSAFQEAEYQNPSAYILPWSSRSCWSCSNDCSVGDGSTSQGLTSTVPTSEQTTTAPTRTEPPTTFVSSYVPTTTESIMPQCTLALSDGCVFDQNYEDSDCNKYGAFRSTFTLREEEYPWQIDTRNCAALCYHMPSRCKASGWDNNLQKCAFSPKSIHDSSFTPGNGDGTQYWSEQSCYKCFCHDQDQDEYYASLRTALPTATCAPSVASEETVCEIKQNPSSDLVCQHSGYFPWAYDVVPDKFPYQDSEQRCAALCNSNPDCVASAWSEDLGKCAIGYHQLKYITWQQFGSDKLSWSDKGCWDCSDCIKSQKWRIINV
ncbi:hypothetical protein F53441_4785 [Fusarium austroafricanum]|uniref:Apple domain-containing protein n=1 Tax=Fusarium austroafricanum TaxID=2364996 RepID=A0A8H4KMD5_9HYPO|nr:hypothetical protein F53441_4785 [Fusarium austroafricanum]